MTTDCESTIFCKSRAPPGQESSAPHASPPLEKTLDFRSTSSAILNKENVASNLFGRGARQQFRAYTLVIQFLCVYIEVYAYNEITRCTVLNAREANFTDARNERQHDPHTARPPIRLHSLVHHRIP